jgi:hypothetical protein
MNNPLATSMRQSEKPEPGDIVVKPRLYVNQGGVHEAGTASS